MVPSVQLVPYCSEQRKPANSVVSVCTPSYVSTIATARKATQRVVTCHRREVCQPIKATVQWTRTFVLGPVAPGAQGRRHQRNHERLRASSRRQLKISLKYSQQANNGAKSARTAAPMKNHLGLGSFLDHLSLSSKEGDNSQRQKAAQRAGHEPPNRRSPEIWSKCGFFFLIALLGGAAQQQ